MGATVSIVDLLRDTKRTATTDESGAYALPNMVPSSYTVRAVAVSFQTQERPNIRVEVATDVTVDFVLTPGELHETISVIAAVPLVNATNSTLGGTLSNKEINDLPLNGRNYENLLQLRPGVVRYPGGGFSTTSSNGLRAEDNAYLVDGLFNSEPFSGQSIINGAGIAGDSATILPIDAIQEFNVQENPPAEYGWKPGAIINVALKSGTNDLHGTAYAFGRETSFDARNFFNTVESGSKNPHNLEQYGGTAGGAIVKGKLFYFGGFEGLNYAIGNTSQIQSWATVPLPNAGNCKYSRKGDCANSIPDAFMDVHDAYLAGAIRTDVSAVSLRIAGCSLGSSGGTCDGKGFPLNNGTNPAGANLLNYRLLNTVSSDNAVGKIDYQPADTISLSTSYFLGNTSGSVSDASELQPQWLTNIHTRAQVVGENWTWTPSSRWVNEARAGYNRLYQPTSVGDHDSPATKYGLNTGVTNPLYGGLPRINIAPYYVFPQELGGFNWPKVQGPDTRIQFIDHLSYRLGSHSIKFGGELHRDAFTGGAYGGARGRIKFGFGNQAFPGDQGIEDFFAGVPTSGSLLVGDPTRHIHNEGFAGFIQDDWHANARLTINFGLRYEINTVIKEAHNLLGNFAPSQGLVQVGDGVRSPYKGDHTDLGPRVGFAWDISGRGNTVLRAGGGLMYETLNWESFLAFNNSLGLATIPTGAIIDANGKTAGGSIAVGTVNLSGSDPTSGGLNWDPAVTGVPGTVFPITPINCFANPCSVMGVHPNLRTPYVWNWTFGVQHAINQNLLLEVSYVGDHGSKLTGIRDINQLNPNSAAEIACGHCEQNGRPYYGQFPYLNSIYQMSNMDRSNYNSLQTTLTARDYHGLRMVLGYTYSHALDDVGANWDFGAGLGLPSDSNHPGDEYASSDYDMRQRLTVSLTYAIPGREGWGQILHGWQLNSIVSVLGAQPFGVMDAGTDVSRTGENNDRWDFFGRPSDFRASSTGIPYYAPGASNMPASCWFHAAAMGATASLNAFGCYANGDSVMIPPAFGTEGMMGRNVFRDTGLQNFDLSISKKWNIHAGWAAQFRAEFFNAFNHPNFANPFGGQNGWAHNDPSTGSFGCSCATPDVAASNPVIGSGGSRAVQFGVKLSF